MRGQADKYLDLRALRLSGVGTRIEALHGWDRHALW